MKKFKCPFLGLEGTEEYLGTMPLGTKQFISGTFGTYGTTSKTLQSIEQYRFEKKLNEDQTNQGLVNCAKEILKSNKSEIFPLILDTNSYENFKRNKEEIEGKWRQPILAINFQDCLDEKVDHTLKPIKLLNLFSSKLQDTHAFAAFSPTIEDMVMAQIAGKDELREILNYLWEEKFLVSTFANSLSPPIIFKNETLFTNQYKFTIQGWHQIRKEREKTNTNKVFIATAFHWPEEETLWKEVIDAIKKACKSLGWDADIVSQGHTDYITDRIMSEIKLSRFVIAELTYNNRGVYFESGYARGLGKNVFHIVRQGFNRTDVEAEKESKKLHFDIQQIQYRVWKTPKDVENELFNWMNGTIGEYKNT